MGFKIVPEINILKSLQELCESYALCADDLIISNRFVLEPAAKGMEIPCDVLYQEDYGTGEPSDEMVDAMLADIEKKDCRRLVAIGGGTVIDISKLFVFGKGYACKQIFDEGATLQKKRELIVVPTTCGTGSEVTNISIVEFKSAKTKKGLAIPQLFPNHAVLIPAMLETLPHEVFAASSIDALIHAVESYISPKANVFTKLFGKRAIQMILGGYKKLIDADFSPAIRNGMLEEFLVASTYAGVAFGNAGCGAVHALSYPLGAVFHIPHGKANYLMMTAVFQKYTELGANLDELEQVLGECIEGTDVWQGLTAILDAVLERKPLSQFGMEAAQTEEFAKSVVEQQQRLLVNAPVELSQQHIQDIYKACF